ncbi:TPA: hypothetical protein QFN72_001907, partial [Enterococcus faecium]
KEQVHKTAAHVLWILWLVTEELAGERRLYGKRSCDTTFVTAPKHNVFRCNSRCFGESNRLEKMNEWLLKPSEKNYGKHA